MQDIKAKKDYANFAINNNVVSKINTIEEKIKQCNATGNAKRLTNNVCYVLSSSIPSKPINTIPVAVSI